MRKHRAYVIVYVFIFLMLSFLHFAKAYKLALCDERNKKIKEKFDLKSEENLFFRSNVMKKFYFPVIYYKKGEDKYKKKKNL